MATKKHDQSPSSSKTTIHIANNRYVGISHKGIFGEETYFDENGHYAGYKKKGLLGEENYFDSKGRLVATTRDAPLGTKIITDKNGHYVGTSYQGMGSNRVTILDGDTDPAPKHNSPAAWGFLIASVCFCIM